ARILFEPLAGIVVPREPQLVEGPLLRLVAVVRLELHREVVRGIRESGRHRRRRAVAHAEVVLIQAIALTGLVGHQFPQVILVGALLGRAVERGDQDGLAGARLAEDGNVLLTDAGIFRHGANVSKGCDTYPATPA